MKPHHLSLLATTLVFTLPHYSGSEATHQIFANGNNTDTPPHQGCLFLLNDREPPHTKLVGEEFERKEFKRIGIDDYKVEREAGATAAVCDNSGFAGGYPCSNVDLLSMVDIATLDGAIGGSDEANDIWGWTDSASGREFALIGILRGTAFVEITNATNPVYVGGLPTKTVGSLWRDIKTYGNFAFIVSEAFNHGMQIFDLRALLTANPGTTFSESAHYSSFGNAHNVFINEDTGYAYAVGSNTCSGGLHMVDINDPLNPANAGCYSNDGYTHDVQCVVYKGPDTAYNNSEICFCSNEDTITVVDVTIKTNPIQLSKRSYDNDHYTHQGWLTEDHSHFLFNDELDELRGAPKTRTHIMDVSDLKDISYVGKYDGRTSAIDHNNYVKGDYLYQANYRAGLNILKIIDVTERQFEEAGYFDIYPDSDSSQFNGAWSNYPYFPSGNMVVSGIEQGLFVLKFTAKVVSPSASPTVSPIASDPSAIPSSTPSLVPSTTPSLMPSDDPSSIPTLIPGAVPSTSPSFVPSSVPSSIPSNAPSSNPSSTPTLTPVATPSAQPTGDLVNNSDWQIRKGNGKLVGCRYVAGKKAEKRCKKIGSIDDKEVKACEACLEACSEYPCVDSPTCDGDNPNWEHRKNGKKKGCFWVGARFTKKRCKNKVGVIDGKAVPACEGCCDTCSDHPCLW